MKRNLICHIMPESRGKWRRTVEHIRQRLHLFNGKRIISLVRAPNCDSPEVVKAAFGDDADSFDWLEFENDPCIREVVSFVPMLERVASLDPEEITFCCHGKGATHGHDDSICHCWADLMWIACCDAIELVECSLKDKAICGAFRTQDQSIGEPWHFRGTFYWIRHDKTFSRDWRRINHDFVGTESWPGKQFAWEESACLFMDQTRDLYDEHYWEASVFPAFRFWQASLQRAGLSTTDYSPPKWFLARHPNFRPQTGPAGSDMTPPAKRSWPRLPTFQRLASLFSTR